MNIYESAQAMVGKTPMLRLSAIEKAYHLEGKLIAKLESWNPAGSAKDRVALNMILDAEERGLLKPGATIIEPTSGNTGIGLASVATCRGYKAIIVMPASMSMERRLLMPAYGAELILTPGAQGMSGAIAKAEELAKQISGSFIPDQFNNGANWQAHYKTTGPEIWEDTDGTLDIFVAGVGTGGTVTGTGKYFKEKNPQVQVVAVEPAKSPLLSGGKAGPHGLMGIGANFIPTVLDQTIYDRVIPVTEEEAYAAGRLMGQKQGVLAGISSGAALHAAIRVLKENPGKTVVVLLPDSGERYLSTPMYAK